MSIWQILGLKSRSHSKLGLYDRLLPAPIGPFQRHHGRRYINLIEASASVELFDDSQGGGLSHYRGKQALVMVKTPSVGTDSGGCVRHMGRLLKNIE
jgi:hypothetical protein